MKSFSPTLATLVLAISSLSGLAMAQGNPTLVSITLSPSSVVVFPGDINDMQVIGTYNDGSTQDLSLSSVFTSDNPAAVVFGSEPVATGGYPMFYMNPSDPAVSSAPVTITATYSDGTHSFTSTGSMLRLTGGGTAGFPTFSTQDGGPFDFINPATDTVNIGLPVRQKNSSVPFDFSLGASSGAVPYTDPDSGLTLWKVTNNVTGTSSMDVHLKYLSRVVNCGGQGYYVTEYYGFTVLDPSGAVHPLLPGATVSADANAYRCSLGKTAEADTNDGSGYHASIDATKADKGTVYDHAGNIFTYPDGLGSVTLSTPNGNTITKVISGTTQTYTDTLNNTVLVASLPLVTNSSVQWAYKYQDSSHTAWQSYTVTFASYSARTNYGCSTVHDLGVQQIYLPASISVPGGGSYSLTYEHPYNYPGNGTWGPYTDGRIEKLTLPTGGSTSYTYGGTASDNSRQGINCTDLTTVPVVTRTVLDNVNNVSGVWEYDNAAGIPSSLNETVSVKDPASNHEVYQFSNAFKTDKKVYQGAITGTPLSEELVCYNGNTSNCPAPSPAPVYPLSQIKVSRLRNGADDGASYTSLDSTHGIPTVVNKYDVGAVAISSTRFFYGSWNRSTQVCDTSTLNAAHIFSTLCYFQTLDSQHSNAVVAAAFNTFDNSGNLLEAQKWVSGSVYLRTFFTYNGNGTVHTITDPNGSTVFTFAYDGTNGCSSLLPTSVSTSPVALSSSQEYDCYGGVVTKSTGPNGTPSTFTQNDPLWRQTSSTDPSGYIVNSSYTTNSVTIYSSFNGGTLKSVTTLDGLGRPILSQTYQGAGTGQYDTVRTTYDNMGRVSNVSAPFTSGLGTGTCTSPCTQSAITYDALGRVLTATDANGGKTTHTYTNADDLAVISPAPTGEHVKQRQSHFDGLGRLISVCEISGTLPGVAACTGQANTPTGYLTSYAYDALGRMTGVTQGVQTRTFVYDSLGRLTSETNPENGVTSYTWDASTICSSTSGGDLLLIVRATGNRECIRYDSAHRVIEKTLTGGVRASHFVWDSDTITVNGIPVALGQGGKIASAYTCPDGTNECARTAATTDEGFTYDTRGNTTAQYQKSTNSGGWLYYGKGTDAIGGLHNFWWEDGQVITANGWDGEGRLSSVSTSWGTVPFTSVTYSPFGPTGITYGSGDTDAFTYDNIGHVASYQFNVGTGGQDYKGVPTWNANGTLGSLVTTNSVPGVNPNVAATVSYTYDDLGRVIFAQDNHSPIVLSQSYTDDQYGNNRKNGQPYSWIPPYGTGYVAATNRYATGGTCPGSGIAYDADGNLLCDTFHSYTWDASDKLVSVDGHAILRDAFGRTAESSWWSNGATTYEVLHTPMGDMWYTGLNLQWSNVKLPGGGSMYNVHAGPARFNHPDWQGNARLSTDASTRTFNSSTEYAPFGESYNTGGSPNCCVFTFNESFMDIVSGLYDTPNRELHPVQGRWIQPDPAGLAAVNPSNPQSWNRYAYVLNNPLSNIDPLGLECVWDDGSYDSNDDPNTGSPGQCDDAGGTWVDHSFFAENGLADWSADPNPDINNYAQNFTATVTATPCSTSATTGQRVTAGIQGFLNVGLGEAKTFGYATLGVAGVAGAPETGGVSLLATAAAGYGIVTSQGQVTSGVGQLVTAFGGNLPTGQSIQQVGDIVAGPVVGVPTLVATQNLATAQKAANVESFLTAGSGLVNSKDFTESLQSAADLGLSAMGLAGDEGCK